MDRNLTANRNLLSPTKFRLVINSTRYANTEFFCVEAPLPGMTLPDVALGMGPGTAYVPGDKIEYSDITFRIMVDEELTNYREICNWIWNNHSKGISYEDMILQIYSSSVNKTREVKFISCFPTTIGSVTFNTQANDVEYLSVDVTFRYDRFQFVS